MPSCAPVGYASNDFTHPNHTFSAFWLRSSVVSVLISLISDTADIVRLDIKLIFIMGWVTNDACIDAPARVASVLHCLRARHTSFGRVQTLPFPLLSTYPSVMNSRSAWPQVVAGEPMTPTDNDPTEIGNYPLATTEVVPHSLGHRSRQRHELIFVAHPLPR